MINRLPAAGVVPDTISEKVAPLCTAAPAASCPASPQVPSHAPPMIIIKLSEKESKLLIVSMEKIAQIFNSIDENDWKAKADALRNHLTQLDLYSKNDSFRALADQLIVDTRNGGFYDETRKLNDSLIHQGFNILLGVFQVPYLSGFRDKPVLAALTFSGTINNELLDRDFGSNAVALDGTCGTELWELDRLGKVAIFPEFWRSSKNDPPDAKAYYLADRFADRMKDLTKPVLKKAIDLKSFTQVRAALKKRSLDDLNNAIFVWLNNHEHNHARGLLPRVNRSGNLDLTTDKERANAPYGYQLKDSREGGAFEELRVDLRTLVSLFNMDTVANQPKNFIRARELILLERLIRYPIQKDPNDNFDAITSHMLLNYLFEKEAIYFRNERLSINEKTIGEALKTFLYEFENLERKISKELDLSNSNEMAQAKAEIQHFVRYWACRHNATDARLQDKINMLGVPASQGGFDYKKDYPLHPFYDYAKSSGTKAKWSAELTKLIRENSFTVYRDSSMTVNDAASLVSFLKKHYEASLSSEDQFLALLAAGDIEAIDHLDPKFIYLVNQAHGPKVDQEFNQIIREEIPNMVQKLGKTFQVENFDDRFLYRVKALIKHKVEQCRNVPKEQEDSLTGTKYVKDLADKGEKAMATWRQRKFYKPIGIPVSLVFAICGGAWALSGQAIDPQLKSQPATTSVVRPDDRDVGKVAIHEKVLKPVLQPEVKIPEAARPDLALEKLIREGMPQRELGSVQKVTETSDIPVPEDLERYKAAIKKILLQSIKIDSGKLIAVDAEIRYTVPPKGVYPDGEPNVIVFGKKSNPVISIPRAIMESVHDGKNVVFEVKQRTFPKTKANNE